MQICTKRNKVAEIAQIYSEAAKVPESNRERIVAVRSAKIHGEKKLAWLGLCLVFLCTVFNDGVLDLAMNSQEVMKLQSKAPIRKSFFFGNLMVQAQSTAAASGGDYENYDPAYDQNTLMTNADTSAAISRYVASSNIFKTQFLTTETNDCDQITNFSTSMLWGYTCIFDQNNFQQNLNGVDDFTYYNPTSDMTDDYYWSACYDYPPTHTDPSYCFYSYITAWYNEQGGSASGSSDVAASQESILDPCLSWYENGVCARCKFGSIRVFNGNGIYCGYLVTEQTCQISNWHLENYDIPAQSYQVNNRYFNHTSSYQEIVCVVDYYTAPELYPNCTTYYSQYVEDSTWDTFSTERQSWAEITLGCRECTPDADATSDVFSVATYDERFGVYLQACFDTKDQTGELNDICGDGQIMQWEGVIESERVLKCKFCSELIPGCLSCLQASSCELCQKGYLRSEIIDSEGNTNIVCLQEFCGFYGEGSACLGTVGIEGCDRSNKLLVNRVWVENCIRCSPGYYLTENPAYDTTIYRCSPQNVKVSSKYFVAPFDSIDMTDAMLGMTPDGSSWNNPFLQIQHALYNFQGNHNTISGAFEANVQVFLMKGVHHYITCLDWDETSAMNSYMVDTYAILCADKTTKTTFASLVDHMVPQPQTTDNLKISFLAMDCKYKDSYLAGLTDDQFDATCVDVAAGEKVQIRLASPYSYFNITNVAHFENIEFTGEDMFASATHSGAAMGFQGQWGVLAYMPFTKCTVREDPWKISTIDDIWLYQMNHLKMNNFEYTCESNFVKATNKPPSAIDERCFPPEYLVNPVSDSCTGEPHHSDFWHYSAKNLYFTKRHKVLFNLYAFDPMRTTNKNPPKLEIVNCSFKYFVGHLDALIQVETNNLGYFGQQVDANTDNRFMVFYGEDRGAMITIENSEFYSSSFCKGLIYYNQFQTITYSEAQTFLNFTSNTLARPEPEYDTSATNQIRIKESKFKNIGFHQVIQALTLDSDATKQSTESFISTINWNRFQDQGLILNTNGYSGSIEVKDCEIEANIAYIQEMLIYESLTTDTFYDFKDKEMIIEFSDTDQTSLQFKKCVDVTYTSNYFFKEVIDPDKEFDDSVVIDTIENVSVFMIKGNEGAMIFSGNEFKENIGTTGGVIHIESPEFRYGDKPYIVMYDNKFVNNMAYWAGNAFHIQMQMRMIYGNTHTAGSDSWQTCASGILIDENYFYGNVGLKKHNGGAGVIRCIHTPNAVESQFTYRSGKMRQVQTDIYPDGRNYTYLDDPSTHKTLLQDLFDEEQYYELLSYGTWIKNNTFANNYSGKRGSALLLELINNLLIEDNEFKNNGPVQAYREIEFSPYYKHFLYNERTVSFYLLGLQLGNCVDESAWFNRCYRSGYEIDMPQVQGALYIKNCHSVDTCWFVEQDSGTALASTTPYENYTSFFKPWQNVQIRKNYFYNNQANIVMFNTQTQPQASSIFIYGGLNTTISDNEFTGHRNWANSYMQAFARDIYKYYPANYFAYSQATMIRIEYPYEVYADLMSQQASLDVNPIHTQIANNQITNNLNMQVVTYSALQYKASLIEYDCQVQNATLQMNDNTITRNQFIGQDSTFIYINGGIASVSYNQITYNGLLTQNVMSANDEGLVKEYTRSEFPWEDYSFNEAQDKGIFWFDFVNSEMPKYKSHYFFKNNFEHIYCQIGCAYYVTGSEIQQFAFVNNNYNIMVSTIGAAVFYGNVDLQASNKLAQVWIQSYRNEVFNRIFGGSIQLTGNNVPITIIDNSQFINNFGTQGASISFNKGGGLYITDTQFYLEYKNDFIRNALENNEIDDLLPYLQQLFQEAMFDIYTTYNDRLAQKFLLDRKIYDEVISKTENLFGQVYLKQSKNTILNDSQPVFAFDNRSLTDLIKEIFIIEVANTSYSSMRDFLFQDNIGQGASAIYLDNSELKFYGTNSNENFKNNITPQGPTIFATFSNIDSFNMAFDNNKGYQGACYQLDSTTVLTDLSSSYNKNQATQGGVIFAINDSQFQIRKGRFTNNFGNDGAVLYAMYNSSPRALSFEYCQFLRNTANQNLMQLMSSKAYFEYSTFTDNSATFVNHGITMITSETEFYNSQVTFSPGYSDNLDLQKLDCGFFSLFLSSTIRIANQSRISNLKALNQAVLSAFSLSNVFVSNDVQFVNNTAISSAGQTISLQNTNRVEIDGAHFEKNYQTNILVELGTMSVVDSTFTEGRKNHISGIDSIVTLDNVRMYNSTASSSGHGFTCSRCSQVGVNNSRFEDLESTGGDGGAIMIQSLYNSTYQPVSYIMNNEFHGNKGRSGGAIILDSTHMIQVSDNMFEENEATHSDGGAIIYKCDPTKVSYSCYVSLFDNNFKRNLAHRKGGALRYENANFTDTVYIKKYKKESSWSNLFGGGWRRDLQPGAWQRLANALANIQYTGQAKQAGGNTYEDNFAAYGNDLASFPHSILYQVPENDAGANVNFETLQMQIAAGQEFELDLYILDQEGRVYTDENQAIAKIIFVPGQELGSQALMLGSDAVAKEGKFSFNAFKVRIKPSTSAQITIQFQGLEHYGTAIDFLDDFPVFTVTARECIQGEQYTEDLSCKPCPAAFYLYEAQTSPGVCKDCQPEAYCYGMNNTAPKPGYWRSSPTLEEYTACIRPESCLGGSETDPLGQCAEGYQGILCNDCMPGYSRAGLDCNLCPALFWNVVIFLALIIGLVLVIAFLVKSTLGGVDTKKPLHQVFLKIFMNHFQILAAVSQIDFKWPALIQTILQSQQGVADGPSSVLSVDCIMMDMFPNSKPTIRLNYVRLIMFTLMPFIIQIVSSAFWNCYGRCKRVHPQERNDKSTATAIIVLFLFYPTIVSILAKSLNCMVIEGETRLFDDLEEVCYTGTHLLVVLTVSMPGLIAWAAGIPIYALVKLNKNFAALAKIKKFTEGKQHEDLLRRFKVRLGFLTAGYSDTYYMWEIVLLMRKTVLVLLIVFLSSVSSGVQSLSAILILTVFFMVQWRLQPYYDPELNAMETLSLFVIILTIYAGLYYQAGEGEPIMESQIVTWIIFLFVLVPSVLFAINFSKKMWVEILKQVAGKSAKLFRYLTCGSIDITDFKRMHMDENSDDDDDKENDIELQEAPANETQLIGFKAKDGDQEKSRQNRISMLRKKKHDEEEAEKEEEQQEKHDLADKDESDSLRALEAMQGGTDSLNSQAKDSVMDSQSELDAYNKNYLSSRDDIDMQSAQREKNERTLGDLQESVIVAEGHDEETGMPKMQVEQNFEYKEEIQFRGEQVTEKSQKKALNEVNKDKVDMTKAQLQVQQDRSKSGMGKLVSGHMDSMLGSASENDFVNQSRNNANHQRSRSAFQKGIGVTSMVSEDSNIEKAGKPVKAQNALAKMKRSGVSSGVVSVKESNGSPRVDTMMTQEEGKAIARIHGETNRKKVHEEDDEAIPDTKNSKNIFREKEQARKKAERGKSTEQKNNFNNIFKQGDRPTPTKEQLEAKPRSLFNARRDPKDAAGASNKGNNVSRLGSDQTHISQPPSLSDEEGKADRKIRGDTQRQPDKNAKSSRTNKSKMSQGGRSAAFTNDFQSDEEGKGVANIRGDTQRQPDNAEAQPPANTSVFYQKPSSANPQQIRGQNAEAGAANAGEVDQEAQEIEQKGAGRKRRRTKKNKNKGKDEGGDDIFGETIGKQAAAGSTKNDDNINKILENALGKGKQSKKKKAAMNQPLKMVGKGALVLEESDDSLEFL